MNIYLAASSDTKTKISAYAFRVGNYETLSAKHVPSTTPRELLLGLKNMFNYIIQHGVDRQQEEFVLLTNNEFIINMINEDKISEWKRASWVKANGEEVSNKDIMPALYNFLMYFKERSRTVFATKPVDADEVAILNSVSRAALAKRKS